MKMRSFTVLILLLLIAAIPSMSTAQALNGSSQTIDFAVEAINEIAITSHPTFLTINTTMINSRVMKIIDATSTYSITTNEADKKITGVLNFDLPEYTCLIISLEAPTGAKRIDNVLLSHVPIDLVTGITKVAESNKIITYQLRAPASTPWNTPLPETMTLTITN